LWDAAEPIEETVPSPTRAMIVSSPAPPTRRSMLARTVTRATAITWIPSFATATTRGVSITFGLTLTWTASSTSRPARSIAVARCHGRSMLARSAEMSAVTTRPTLPPARWWASIWPTSRTSPALLALMKGRTISAGLTFRSRIPISVPMPTRTPEKMAVIQSPIGTK
jgi:hypothetical protein